MTLITVAIISSIVGPAILWWLNRRELKNRVGTPNGQGTTIQMIERILVGQGQQDERLERVEERLTRIEQSGQESTTWLS